MFIEVLRQTIMITSLVLIMMTIIEYFNVVSQGKLGQNLLKSKFKQILVSALLGLIPGCFGGFAVVSMFTHELVNFGALIAGMIASTGDESFVILSMMPKTAVLLDLCLLFIAILTGMILNFFVSSYALPLRGKKHLVIHNHEFESKEHSWKRIAENLKTLSFTRAILILGLFLFLFGIFTGQFEHGSNMIMKHAETRHSNWGFENILFLGITIVGLYILLMVDDHFLDKHLWEHIIRKHFLRIFLWTFGTLLGITFLTHYVNITPWLQKNQITILILAVLIGIIPESGPHLIFVTLFFNGAIPFSIFMANSIVQDGHSSLPLLAESKRSFILVKGLNLIIALLIGFSGYYFKW